MNRPKIFESIFAGIYNRIKDRPRILLQARRAYKLRQSSGMPRLMQKTDRPAAPASQTVIHRHPIGPPLADNIIKNTYAVDLRTNSGTKTVQVADKASADHLIATLKSWRPAHDIHRKYPLNRHAGHCRLLEIFALGCLLF